MNLKAWRAQRRGTLTLPSGLTVQVQKVELMDLVMQGDIPMPLFQRVYELYQSGAFQDAETLSPRDPEMEELLKVVPEAMKMFDMVARAALVEPAAADETALLALGPDEAEQYLDTHIRLAELLLQDKEAIFNWAAAGAVALAPFRERSDSDAAARPDGAALSHTPQ